MHDLAVIGNGLKYFFTFSCVRNSHVSKTVDAVMEMLNRPNNNAK